MATFTTRLALTKPADPEAVDVSVLNADLDLIDYGIGAIIVNPGVTPPNTSLFDGAIIKERGLSGLVWIAEKNGGGYNKIYLYAGNPVFLNDVCVSRTVTNPGDVLGLSNGVTLPLCPFIQEVQFNFGALISAGGSAADISGVSIRVNGTDIKYNRGSCLANTSILGSYQYQVGANVAAQVQQLIVTKVVGSTATTFIAGGLYAWFNILATPSSS